MGRKIIGVIVTVLGVALTGFSIYLLLEGAVEAIFIGITGVAFIISGIVLVTSGAKRFFEALMDSLGF